MFRLARREITARYLNCVSKIAEFTTELAIESHQSLEIPYVDPYTARTKRNSLESKEAVDRIRDRAEFERFVVSIRKKQPFLRKATEKELEGIFARLTPSEKRLYSEEASSPDTNPKAPKVSKTRESKKGVKESKAAHEMRDFISDEMDDEEYFSDESDDVSLVSESDSGVALEKEDIVPKKKKKKSKKDKREKKSREPSMSSVPGSTAGVKKFTWT